jgi:hypothetical protein
MLPPSASTQAYRPGWLVYAVAVLVACAMPALLLSGF